MLATKEFTDWSAGYVLFAHITTQVPGDKHQDLLAQKGGNGFPHLVMLEPSGMVVAQLEGDRDVAGFAAMATKGQAKAAEIKKLVDAAAGGDKAAQVALFKVRLEVGSFASVADARKEFDALADADKAALEQPLYDFSVRLRLGQLTSQEDALAAGKEFAEAIRAGKSFKGDAGTAQGYWSLAVNYAKSVKDVTVAERCIAAITELFGDNENAQRFVKQLTDEVATWKAEKK